MVTGRGQVSGKASCHHLKVRCEAAGVVGPVRCPRLRGAVSNRPLELLCHRRMTAVLGGHKLLTHTITMFPNVIAWLDILFQPSGGFCPPPVDVAASSAPSRRIISKLGFPRISECIKLALEFPLGPVISHSISADRVNCSLLLIVQLRLRITILVPLRTCSSPGMILRPWRASVSIPRNPIEVSTIGGGPPCEAV